MNKAVPTPIGVVAHYTLLEQLEPAGPGNLYRARDTRLGRTVAVRVLPAAVPADVGDRQSFLEAARRAMVRSHPNVIALFDVGEHEGRIYLVFEFISGRSLRAEMGGRLLNVRRAVELATEIADAVSDGHAAGLGRARLSPDSLVVTAKGHAKIPAFELATREGFEEVDGHARVRDYESPEEAGGEKGDERSDVYSAGAVLFEMLTTRRPLHKGSAAPSASNPLVPRELDQVVLRAVSPNPDRRQQTAALLSADLRVVLALIDSRGQAGAEAKLQEARSTSVGRVVAVTGAILAAVVAILWLVARG